MSLVKLMMIDDSRNGGDKYVLSPNWEEVESNVRILNGLDRTYVCLYKDEEPTDEEFLLLGGGKDGIYVCTYYNGDEFAQINPLYKEDNTTVMVPVGQTSGKFRKQCISLPQLIEATRYFYHHGSIEGADNWEML